MSDKLRSSGVSDGEREGYARILKERAAGIKSVRTDIFNTKWWQLALNFLFGGLAVAGLIASMTVKGTAGTALTVVGVVFMIAVVVYNFALRTVAPMSVVQYTRIDNGRRYCYQILSKTRSAFSDGTDHIETERGNVTRLRELACSQYAFDFFADMRVDGHFVSGETETFTGVYAHSGKRYKCKIVFDGETPLYGSIGGGRIKYFDVNDPKSKFVVPAELARAVKSVGVVFPKLSGVRVRDDIEPTIKHKR